MLGLLNIRDKPFTCAGLLGAGMSDKAVLAELAAALELAAGARGPLVLVLVLSAGCTFTAEEAGCLRRLLGALGPAALDHAMLLFTHGDELEADDVPLYEYLRESPRYLKVLPTAGRVALTQWHGAGRVWKWMCTWPRCPMLSSRLLVSKAQGRGVADFGGGDYWVWDYALK